MKDIVNESLLFDFYGSLLTEKRQEVMSLYYEEDMSLSEISEELGISRPAVHDSLKSSEKKLAEYEKKLGLVEKYRKRSLLTGKISEELDALEKESSEIHDEAFIKKIAELKVLIAQLERD